MIVLHKATVLDLFIGQTQVVLTKLIDLIDFACKNLHGSIDKWFYCQLTSFDLFDGHKVTDTLGFDYFS